MAETYKQNQDYQAAVAENVLKLAKGLVKHPGNKLVAVALAASIGCSKGELTPTEDERPSEKAAQSSQDSATFSTEFRTKRLYRNKGSRTDFTELSVYRDAVTYWKDANTRYVLMDDWAKVSDEKKATIDQKVGNVDKRVLTGEDPDIDDVQIFRNGVRTGFRPDNAYLKEATKTFLKVAKSQVSTNGRRIPSKK